MSNQTLNESLMAAYRLRAIIDTAAMALEHVEDQTDGRHVAIVNAVRSTLESATADLDRLDRVLE